MRINKYIATCGVASRRKSEELILSGRIKLNGQMVIDLSTEVNETDVVELDNKKIVLPITYEYYILNKPRGYVSTVCDDRGRKTVIQLIKTNARVYPIGRLDYDSEGMLLLTNDGELTYKLTHPKNEVKKTYIVDINSILTEHDLSTICSGVIIDGYKLNPPKVQILKEANNYTRMKVIINEGRNREIRKMFETIHKKVIFLQRIAIGSFFMTNLKKGEYRKLTCKELDYLKSL